MHLVTNRVKRFYAKTEKLARLNMSLKLFRSYAPSVSCPPRKYPEMVSAVSLHSVSSVLSVNSVFSISSPAQRPHATAPIAYQKLKADNQLQKTICDLN